MALKGRKVMLQVEELFNVFELWYPYYCLKEAKGVVRTPMACLYEGLSRPAFVTFFFDGMGGTEPCSFRSGLWEAHNAP